jgi:hypothetical protein
MLRKSLSVAGLVLLIAVAARAQSPASKAASADAPKTGALKLQLGRSDAPAVLLVLEGKVAKGTMAGEMSGDAGPGTFKLTRKP